MSGEGKSVSFRRTKRTAKSNQELLEEFKDLVYSSKKIMSHMKWYGYAHSVYMEEHGDEELEKWQKEYVAIKDTFNFCISVYDSWHEDADLYESHEREDSFVSLAREFAQNNGLMYFSHGYPAEWYEKNEQGQYQHYKVQPNDKNIDKICNLWHRYGIMVLQAFDEEIESQLWNEAKTEIKQLMTL
jgi:hypothetical protein